MSKNLEDLYHFNPGLRAILQGKVSLLPGSTSLKDIADLESEILNKEYLLDEKNYERLKKEVYNLYVNDEDDSIRNLATLTSQRGIGISSDEMLIVHSYTTAKIGLILGNEYINNGDELLKPVEEAKTSSWMEFEYWKEKRKYIEEKMTDFSDYVNRKYEYLNTEIKNQVGLHLNLNHLIEDIFDNYPNIRTAAGVMTAIGLGAYVGVILIHRIDRIFRNTRKTFDLSNIDFEKEEYPIKYLPKGPINKNITSPSNGYWPIIGAVDTWEVDKQKYYIYSTGYREYTDWINYEKLYLAENETIWCKDLINIPNNSSPESYTKPLTIYTDQGSGIITNSQPQLWYDPDNINTWFKIEVLRKKYYHSHTFGEIYLHVKYTPSIPKMMGMVTEKAKTKAVRIGYMVEERYPFGKNSTNSKPIIPAGLYPLKVKMLNIKEKYPSINPAWVPFIIFNNEPGNFVNTPWKEIPLCYPDCVESDSFNFSIKTGKSKTTDYFFQDSVIQDEISPTELSYYVPTIEGTGQIFRATLFDNSNTMHVFSQDVSFTEIKNSSNYRYMFNPPILDPSDILVNTLQLIVAGCLSKGNAFIQFTDDPEALAEA